MNSQNVLMFHDVINERFPKSGFKKPGALQYTISEKLFEKIVDEAIKFDKNIIFSFDDGGSSFYDIIAPILERVSRKGMFFISTDYIGKEGFLTVKQIIDLDKRGHVIASHSHTHPRDISKLSNEGLRNEWEESKRILEGLLGHSITKASVPGGAVSKRVVTSMIKAGYEDIYTSIPTNKKINMNGVDVYGRFTISNQVSIPYIQKVLTDGRLQRKLIFRYRLLRFGKLILGSNYNKIKQYILKITR